MDADSDNKGGQSNSVSVPGLPDGCSVNDITKIDTPKECNPLNDNNSLLTYHGNWIVNSSDSTDVSHRHTVHFVQTPGASVSLTLTQAVSIVKVFGLVPPGSSPPQASYTIDNVPLSSNNLPETTTCVPNQLLFASGPLDDTGPHNMTIVVTQASADQPYILDYLWLCAQSAKAVHNETGSESSPSAQQLSAKDVAIISLASVLGIVILALGVYIAWRKRRSKALSAKLPMQTDASINSDGLQAASLSTSSTVNISALEEGNTRPPSYITTGFTAEDERRLSYSSILQALTTPSSTSAPDSMVLEKATLFHPVVPSLRRTPNSLNPRRQFEEDDSTMGGEASDDDEPPPTYISH